MKTPLHKISAGTLIMGMLLSGGTLSLNAQTPKIVVGIMVDQLRGDYLEQLRPYFGSRGFNRLFAEGVYLSDLDFHNTVKDAPSGSAVIYTGAWPVANGVVSADVIDLERHRSVPVLSADPSKLKPEYSPAGLRLSTLADELALQNGALSKIYSVAGNPQVAVITAGHEGNAAIWLDESTSRWNSPAYYGTMPPVIANKSRTAPVSSKITSANWRPLHTGSHYSMGGLWTGDNFSYTFGTASRDDVARFKQSAPFNTEVTDAAIDLLKSMQSGSASSPAGMISLEYSLAPIDFDHDGDNRPELIDSYVRLDEELGRLIDAIYRDYGAQNALIFLSSTGYANEPTLTESQSKIPSGEITLKKAESLLNSYLSANYGNGDYVRLIRDGKLYLDEKFIRSKGADLSKIREEAKFFLLRMGGVSEAYTLDEVLGSGNSRAQQLSLSVDIKNTPDIFIFFTPGWSVTDDNAYPPVTERVRLSSPPTPAFILAPELEPQTVSYSVDATVMAPTVAQAMHIRSPNGAASKPLILKRKSTY